MNVRQSGQRRQLATKVHSALDASDQLREIWLRGPGLAQLRFSPGSHVVVRVPTASGSARRVYSVWSWVPQHSLIVIRVAIHGNGRDAPGCAWALRVQPGDAVSIEPPRSKISIDPTAAYHLFAGDETGAVPLLAMRAAIHQSGGGSGQPHVVGVFETATVGAEVPDFAEVPPMPWVYRGRASAVASPVLLRAVRELDLPPGPPGTAYLAGESKTCQLLQQHFVAERGWPRRSVKVQQQWSPGRPGFGAGPDDPGDASATATSPTRTTPSSNRRH